MRYTAQKNRSGGPGWNIIDSMSGQSIAWIYDHEYGHKHPENDERRAKKFAAILNVVDNPEIVG